MVARYAQLMASPESQLIMMAASGSLPNRVSLAKTATWKQSQAILEESGTYDLGLTTTTYNATRPIFPRLLQKLWSGELTPSQVVDAYQEQTNEILQQ